LVLLVLVASVGAESPAPEIRRLDQKAAATKPGQYPKEMVAERHDGSYKTALQYDGTANEFVVGLWSSEPGVLQTDSYPHDEYCLVLEGTLVVTNRSGTKDEFKPGDSFVIPKGWAGTWDMKTKFKKQYVASAAS
ncbi:MAG: cupin domain-containing protein, partial [Candidatus Binatia bacterium]